MGFDPNEPRDKDGKWTSGGAAAQGHNAGGGNRTLASYIAAQHNSEENYLSPIQKRMARRDQNRLSTVERMAKRDQNRMSTIERMTRLHGK